MQILALAARGTLDLVAAECRALGLPVLHTTADGVELDLDPPQTARALVHLRVASRLLLRIGGFEAADADALYEGAWAIDWPRWLDADSTFAVHTSGDLVPSRPGRRGLDHHLFVSLKVKDAIADRLVRALGRRPDVAREDPEVRVVVRGRRGRWDVLLDLSDPPLYQRGHRVEPGPAPLKETLGAAIADFVNWQGQGRLHDPMCGSGTLLIEAVNRKLGVAPGCTRWFAVERWPHHGATLRRLLDEERAAAVAHARQVLAMPGDLDIVASDVSPQALHATRTNLAAAGLERLVRVEPQDARLLAPPPAGTTLISNPPYGERLGGEGVEGLYRELGAAWRSFHGSTAWLLDGHPGFAAAFGVRDNQRHALYNGPIAIVLRQYLL